MAFLYMKGKKMRRCGLIRALCRQTNQRSNAFTNGVQLNALGLRKKNEGINKEEKEKKIAV